MILVYWEFPRAYVAPGRGPVVTDKLRLPSAAIRHPFSCQLRISHEFPTAPTFAGGAGPADVGRRGGGRVAGAGQHRLKRAATGLRKCAPYLSQVKGLRIASMGPQPDGHGRLSADEQDDSDHDTSMGPQSGCGKSRRRSRMCTEQCFNGAAMRKSCPFPGSS